MVQKAVGWVGEELREGEEDSPGVGSGNDDALEEDSDDLLAHDLVQRLAKGREEEGRKPVRVRVRVAQLVRRGSDHKVATCIGQRQSHGERDKPSGSISAMSCWRSSAEVDLATKLPVPV